jgi:hypothetical protein
MRYLNNVISFMSDCSMSGAHVAHNHPMGSLGIIPSAPSEFLEINPFNGYASEAYLLLLGIARKARSQSHGATV